MMLSKFAVTPSRINFFVMRRACGGWRMMRAARASALAMRSASSITSLTSPQSRAVSASIRSPVKNSSAARDQPMCRGNNQAPPSPGSRPSLRKVAPKRAERAAMRMAALMGLPALFVFSHDSIGVGSNGPTHQPVEILASFRAMPNMLVFCPADAIETAECWRLALEQSDRPSLFALSRQEVVQVRENVDENLCARGGYVVSSPPAQRDVTLIATGSEVGLAIEAQAALAAKGVGAAVVSLPCWELFERQDASYRNGVLGEAPRIAVEAAVSFGWERWLRPEDRFIGMSGFGASAKAPVLYEHFKIDVPTIVAAAQDAMVQSNEGGT